MKKILIADDEVDCRHSFKNYFFKRDVWVHMAFDGAEAKHFLEGNSYDDIFFDCNMPELSGIELLEVIRETNPKAKKVMISGYELINEDFVKASGVDLFLRKPIALKDMERIIV